jgi:N-acetylglutamate synthase-like GNAT family acetyltransferase
MVYKKTRRNYLLSTDRRKLNYAFISSSLQQLYWASDLSKSEIKISIDHSRAYGIYHNNIQIGFAKVLTDYSRFAYLSDVFILEDYRGKGLGVFLLKGILADPKLKGIKKWMLATRDAHGLYKKFGFTELKNPKAFMQLMKS